MWAQIYSLVSNRVLSIPFTPFFLSEFLFKINSQNPLFMFNAFAFSINIALLNRNLTLTNY